MQPATTTTVEIPLSQPERLALTDAAKINQGGNARASWRVSGDTLQQNLRHCTPLKKELMVWAFQWCIDKQIFLDDFAAQIGYDRKTVDKIITGTYRDPRTQSLYDLPDKLVEGIEAFRRIQLAEAKLGKIEFVITPSSKRIWTACELARESHTPVFLYSASHLGKTWGLEYFAIHNNHGASPLVTVPSSEGLGGFIRAIAAKVGVAIKGNTADLIHRVKGAITPDMVLILDEFHQLIYTYRRESFFACCEVLRSIYDHCGCGMVISTTNIFRTEIEKERKAHLEQLFRRGVHRCQLGDIVLKADASLIFKKNGLDWPAKTLQFDFPGLKAPEKPYEILRMLAKDHGLKAMTERIRYGRKFAVHAKEPLNWKHWTQAHLTIESNAAEPANDWT
ncbi:MAG: AAA family ATPase [Luteolibacter sp.]|uniref:AAA family ATPase n=1 Tax=Luteolibacter sp. TaxID=1962973 RepID=UPI003264233C